LRRSSPASPSQLDRLEQLFLIMDLALGGTAGLISSPGSSLRRAHLFAGLIGPARRAARIAPAEALRST